MSRKIWPWLAAALLIAGVLSLYASSHPDGYEKAGEEVGYIESAAAYLHSPLPDYTIPGLSSALSGSLAGILGVLATFLLFLGLGKWMARRNKKE
ncbi:PDGLE domain-containing protein [Paenibacillus sp. GCM10023252]|uniref:PDGLE domain-containing protein n=1 Tax=Paenibacillus sp. GCM10023252 TaxID=3252649 RepID=UPI003618C852